LNNKISYSPLPRKELGLIFFSAFLIRVAYLLIFPDQGFPDAVAYETSGKEIFSGNLITDDIYMPLYPILTYLLNSIGLKDFFEILISSITTITIYILSYEIFSNEKSALIASIISAVYPHFIFFSSSGLTETIFIFFVILYFIMLYRENFIVAIILMILSILIKPTFDLFNPILLILFLVFHKRAVKDFWKYLPLYFVFYFIFMSPWWVHQYNKYDDFVRLTLSDGIILYTGNNPMNKSGGGITGIDVDFSKFDKITDPIQKNKAMKEEAIDFIFNNPKNFIELGFRKFLRFWRPWPYAKEYSGWHIIIVSISTYGTVLFFSLAFLKRYFFKFKSRIYPIMFSIAYLMTVHIVTISSIRYRLPIEPFLIVFASYFVSESVFFKKLLSFFRSFRI